MRLQKRSLLLTAAVIECVIMVAATNTATAQTYTAEVFLLEEPARDGFVRFEFMAHTTAIPVTEGMSIGTLLINIIDGINNDAGAKMTATGGGGNKILFQTSEPLGSSCPVWVDPESAVDPNGNMFSSDRAWMDGPCSPACSAAPQCSN